MLYENQGPVEPLLLKILRGSNNVMATAVVASVCCAYPTLAGSAALALLKSLECIMLDRSRMANEYITPHDTEISRVGSSWTGDTPTNAESQTRCRTAVRTS